MSVLDEVIDEVSSHADHQRMARERLDAQISAAQQRDPQVCIRCLRLGGILYEIAALELTASIYSDEVALVGMLEDLRQQRDAILMDTHRRSPVQ